MVVIRDEFAAEGPMPRTVEYYDRKTSGLSVRVLPTGKKTFYLAPRCPGVHAR